MKVEDPTIANISSYSDHAVRGDHLYGAESLIFNQIIKSNDRILDIGCGTGRVTRALARAGGRVDACDMESNALNELKKSVAGLQITARLADARNLPYEDEYFDIVVFAFNGLDFLSSIEERLRVIAEMHRVLKPGGHLVISSHNPVGALLSPRGMFRFRSLSHRISRLARGQMMDSYAPDMAGLVLYQGTPRRIIRQIEEVTSFRIVSCYDQTGRIKATPLLTLFSPWPYYHFRKMAHQAA